MTEAAKIIIVFSMPLIVVLIGITVYKITEKYKGKKCKVKFSLEEE